MKKFTTIILIYVVPQLLFSLLDINHAKSYGLILSTLILWMSEVLSLAYTSLLIPLLASLLGILTFQEALSNFSHPILFLFIACFFLSIAFNKSGLDQRISLLILKTSFFSRSSTRLLISISLLSWFLSMWISNTAACAILIPILMGLSKEETVSLSDQLQKKLLISCAYAASIGGLCTPVGSPPNLLALSSLNKAGYEISFSKWITIAMPISLFMLISLLIILNFLYKEKNEVIDCTIFQKRFQELGKFKISESITLISFTLCVFLWIFPQSLMQLGLINHKLSLAQAGLIGTLPLFLVSMEKTKKSILLWKNIQEKLDWGIIFLFAGGLTLGHIMDKSGVANEIATLIFSNQENLLLLGLVITLFGIILSELGSNTASAALILPLISSLAQNPLFSESIVFLTMCATFGASFGFMLPVSTPPNALAFSTGKLKMRDLLKAGIYFDVIGLIIITMTLFFLNNLSII